MRIGSIVIDCADFERMTRFWQEALCYVPREAAGDGWVVLKDPNGQGVNVSLNRVAEPRPGRGRLHLDLYAEDQAAEVGRLLALGATRHPRAAEPGEDFIVLADPEGNLFCVVDTRPRE
jgi:catechol 2,3-dioxygenase-like lactoylglutathione lyase family enzyme